MNQQNNQNNLDKASKYKYQQEIQSMMFTFGDVRNSLQETTQLVEDIVRSQIIELAIQAATISQRRGSRFLSIEDLIFLIRHDRPKVDRLCEFLSWKDVRKNVKASDDADLVDDQDKRPKRKKIKLPWEFLNGFTDVLSEDSDNEDEDYENQEYELSESLQRLKDADRLTKEMSKEEYIEYSECRQASFTYKKAKRFREWIDLQNYIDMKANDDFVEILGFLSWEMVRKLTENSLIVKRDLEKGSEKSGHKTNKSSVGLFATPKEQTAIQSVHVHEAFRRMQQEKIGSFSVFSNGGFTKRKIHLI